MNEGETLVSGALYGGAFYFLLEHVIAPLSKESAYANGPCDKLEADLSCVESLSRFSDISASVKPG